MILVVNAGSSSVKVAVFDSALRAVAAAQATEIGGESALRWGDRVRPVALADHAAAMAAILDVLGVRSIGAVAHRVVHGGAGLVAPCRLTAALEAEIAACGALAPLHNPANLAGIAAVRAALPGVAQYVSFDTAFHATVPGVATRYALPAAAEAMGLRRYGFHGLSYAAMVAGWEGALPRRLLAFHLGNGASACAIVDGRSAGTTMGYSPLDGLTMGTRAGGIDGNAVLRLAEVFGVEGAGHILNRESGLLGLGGASDLRVLRAAGTAEAAFATDHFAYWAVRHGGGLVAAMGGLDAVAFTGGIGENDAAMRAAIAGGFGYLGAVVDPVANAEGAARIDAAGSDVAIRVVPAREERQIAAEAIQVMAGEQA